MVDNKSTAGNCAEETEKDNGTTTTHAPTETTKESAGDGEPAKKKRTAERQITKDDEEEDEDGGNGGTGGTFRKADASVLAKRKILRVKRDAAGKPEVKTNPFANAFLTAKSTDADSTSSNKESTTATSKVFGAGASFSGFQTTKQQPNSATSSFAFGSSSSGSKGFVFGSSNGGSGAATSNIFGAAASSTSSTKTSTTSNLFSNAKPFGTPFTFGKSTSTSSTASASDTPSGANANPTTTVQLPEKVKLTTGEEEEEILFENRCKTHKWVTDTESTDTTSPGTNTHSNSLQQSVPPSTTNSILTDKSNTDATADGKQQKSATVEKEKIQPDKETEGNATNENDSKEKINNSSEKEIKIQPSTRDSPLKQKEEGGQKQPSRWREIGTGPLRILRNKKNTQQLRLVQRRESTPHGPATKVIVNLFLWKESSIQRPSEKHVQVTTLAAEKTSETYLFKFKLVQEAQDLQTRLQKELESCQSITAAASGSNSGEEKEEEQKDKDNEESTATK